MATDSSTGSSGIAIIAMVGQFPGATTLEEFWGNLRDGVDSIWRCDVDDRPADGLQAHETSDFVRAEGVLPDIECFDHQFFDYSPADAELIDPQQRIFLEQAHAALEAAGYNPDTYPGLIGVYAGISTNRYLFNNVYGSERPPDSTRQFHIMVANDKDYLSTRVSYKLNLKGPSYSIQTACSTSLVAIHVACQSLLTGECDMALAGGVTVRVPQGAGYLYEEGMVYSKDGRVRSFDAAASGTVIGNGVGIVVLKLLETALQDRDTILAVIKGSATNNDGSFKASYAAPSKDGQARVILDAQALAGVGADSISYVEAHATGTLLGDPVEVAALTQAFRKHTARTGFCALGSVKSNVGHLDSAAGVAGLIKTVLMLKHRQLVPTVHFATPNPNIDFQDSPFYVSDRLAPWQAQSGPRRAAVSSFGVGGTNAHLIVEEAPDQPPGTPSDRWQLLVLSAKTPTALAQVATDLDGFLRNRADLQLADVAYTLAVGRRPFRYRRAIVKRELNTAGLTESCALDIAAEAPAVEPHVVLVIPRLMPTGRHVERANACYRKLPQFRQIVQDCERALGKRLGFDGTNGGKNELRSAFAAVYSFAMLWMSWGVRPQTIVGQGLGERVADVINGVCTLQEAMEWIDSLAAETAVARDETAPLPIRARSDGVSTVLLSVDAPEDLRALSTQIEDQRSVISVFAGAEQDSGMQPALAMARLWSAGVCVDWQTYYSAEARNRIGLPTYPFARHRHWIDPVTAAASPAAVLHPLLHRNVSSFEQCRFASRFTGREFFLKDHRVGGRRTLPGVAYLEMVRAAVAAACGRAVDETTRLVLKNVVWMHPICVEQEGLEVDIALRRAGPESIEYTVCSRSSESSLSEPERPHSQGLVQLQLAHRPEPLDIERIRAATNERCIEQEPLYQRFDAQGLSYGATHRGVRRIHVGQSQALAQLALPGEIAAEAARFCLHPSIMDAALQATVALNWSDEPESHQEPALPFELEEIEIHGPCVDARYAHVRHSERSGTSSESIRSFDIDVCDEHGAICVRMKRFSTRARARVVTLDDYRNEELIRYIPGWAALPAAHFRGDGVTRGKKQKILAIGAAGPQRRQLELVHGPVEFVAIETGEPVESIVRKLAASAFDQLLWIAPEPSAKSVSADALLEDQRRGVLSVFRIIKALLELGYASRDLAFTVVTRNAFAVLPDDLVEPAHAGVHGLIGSLAQEYEHWNIRLLDLDSSAEWPLAQLFQASAHDPGTLAYRSGEWFNRELVRAQSLPRGQADFRAGGVYVVLGGAGGIGEVLSRYLAERYRAQMIWIGRRAMDDSLRHKISLFPKSAPAPLYITADAADFESLSSAYRQIRQEFGAIHGVVHATIVLADKSLASMEERELLASLAAKVDVSVRMAQVFASEALDFVLFFSSMQSFTRSAGQCNYAAGCVFEDAFAQRLAREWPCVVKTMSWGYWGAQGVVGSAEYRNRMAKAGVGSILPAEGMAALTDLMCSSVPELLLYKGSRTDVLKVARSDASYSLYQAAVPSVIEALRR